MAYIQMEIFVDSLRRPTNVQMVLPNDATPAMIVPHGYMVQESRNWHRNIILRLFVRPEKTASTWMEKVSAERMAGWSVKNW